MSIGGDSRNPLFLTLIERLAGAAGLAAGEIEGQLRPPPQPEMGDYTFPCFALAKKRKSPPPQLAQEMAGALSKDPALQPLFSEITAAGPYLNFRARPGVLCAAILEQVEQAGEGFGESDEGRGRTIVIDYSAPNIAKPFHVGHLMSTILGASLGRIFRALGHAVVGVNHLGDWGTQCGYQFLAWRRADPKKREEELARRGLDYLVDLYVGVNAPAKRLAELERARDGKNSAGGADERARIEAEIERLRAEAEAIDGEARALFKKLEAGDPELKRLWERLRRTTLDVLQKSYDRLGVRFESDAGEGFYEPYLRPMIEDLKARGVLVKSEGAWVIPLSEPGAKKKKPPFIVVKSDGATKYETRDLAAAIYRKKEYDFAQNLYVVDVRQSGHFAGLFRALEKCGYDWARDCHHVSYGMMRVKEGETVLPMTTRGGRMIPLGELLDGMVRIVRRIVEEKNPELSAERKEQTAEAVGVGAVIFWVQSRRRASHITFDWQQATNPDGDTGPYVQYAHARACSILKKHGAPVSKDAELARLTQPEELAVARVLEGFGATLRQAAQLHEPSLIATWLLDLARAFNNFYHRHPVLKAEAPLREARLALVASARRGLAKGLAILGVAAPDEM